MSSSPPRPPTLTLVTLLLVCALVVRVALEALAGKGLEGVVRLRVIAGLSLALWAALAPFHPAVLAWLRALRPGPLALSVASVVTGAALLLQPVDPYWHLLVFVGAGAPLLALRHERELGRLGAIGVTAWLVWWLPLDLRFYERVWTLGLAPDPALPGGGAWLGKTGYPATALLVTALGLAGFGVASRQAPEPLELRPPRPKDVGLGLLALLAVGVVLIPLGLATGFLQGHTTSRLGPGEALAVGLGIALTVALPEELFFRGALDGGLRGHLRRPWASLVVSSFLFGLMHWNNKDEGLARALYVLMASIAGVIYGLVYRRGGLWAAVTCHALVDLVWKAFLEKSRGG